MAAPKPTGPAAGTAPPASVGSASDLVGFALAPFKAWFKYVSVDGVGYWLGLLKISLAAYLVWGVFLLLFAALCTALFLGLGGVDGMAKLGSVALLALALVLAAIFCGAAAIVSWIAGTISATALVYTDAGLSGRRFGIIDSFMAVKWSMLKYMLINWAIGFVVSLPLLLLAALFAGSVALAFVAMPSGGEMAGGLAGAILVAVMFFFAAWIFVLAYSLLIQLFYLVFSFATQFWSYGFLLEGRGVIDSFRRGISIIAARPAEVLVFYVIWALAVGIVSAPVSILSAALNAGFRILPTLMEGMDLAAMAAVYFSLMLAFSALVFLLTTLVQAFSLPTHYLFWKQVKEGVP